MQDAAYFLLDGYVEVLGPAHDTHNMLTVKAVAVAYNQSDKNNKGIEERHSSSLCTKSFNPYTLL